MWREGGIVKKQPLKPWAGHNPSRDTHKNIFELFLPGMWNLWWRKCVTHRHIDLSWFEPRRHEYFTHITKSEECPQGHPLDHYCKLYTLSSVRTPVLRLWHYWSSLLCQKNNSFILSTSLKTPPQNCDLIRCSNKETGWAGVGIMKWG